jgi:cobalamin biosynthesis protein CobW
MTPDGKSLLMDSDRIIHQSRGSEANKLYKIGGKVDALALLGLNVGTETDIENRKTHHDDELDHDHDDFDSFVAMPPVFASMDQLRRRVADTLQVKGVFRIKGHARVDGKAAPVVVQAVGARVETYFSPAPAKDGLVVIGLRNLDRVAATARRAG